MKTRLPSKYPRKSSREQGFTNPRLRTSALDEEKAAVKRHGFWEICSRLKWRPAVKLSHTV